MMSAREEAGRHVESVVPRSSHSGSGRGRRRRQPSDGRGTVRGQRREWRALERVQGDARPGPLGGDRRSGRIEAQAVLIRQLLEETPDITTEELRQALGKRGHAFGYGTIQRFFRRHRITRKKRPATRASRSGRTS